MPELTIVRGREELLEAARPLWLGMRDHHHVIAPELGPIRDDDDSWSRRRAQYEGWLAGDETAYVLLARDPDGTAVGYAVVRSDAWDSPTWSSTGRYAHVESLAVAPAVRGSGIGAALVARVREEARRDGFDLLSLTAVASNVAALRFYEREGFTATFIEMIGPRDTPRRP